jgi:SAM-dependent methyltransferase
MPAGFARLQQREAPLVAAGLAGIHARWLLEVAPTASASPELPVERCRLLVDATACRWPFRAPLDCWPLEDRSVPVILLRHVWQPAIEVDPLDEALRVLKPGGVLISVTANPWHHLAWRELGRDALRLPSWPHFQILHARHGFSLATPMTSQVRGFVPGLSAALVLVARKPAEPARIEPLRFARPQASPGAAAVTHCRAA